MAKQAVNVRLREDQESAIQALIDADKTEETDRSKIVRKAVDEFLARRQGVIREEPVRYRGTKRKK